MGVVRVLVSRSVACVPLHECVRVCVCCMYTIVFELTIACVSVCVD